MTHGVTSLVSLNDQIVTIVLGETLGSDIENSVVALRATSINPSIRD